MENVPPSLSLKCYQVRSVCLCVVRQVRSSGNHKSPMSNPIRGHITISSPSILSIRQQQLEAEAQATLTRVHPQKVGRVGLRRDV